MKLLSSKYHQVHKLISSDPFHCHAEAHATEIKHGVDWQKPFFISLPLYNPVWKVAHHENVKVFPNLYEKFEIIIFNFFMRFS